MPRYPQPGTPGRSGRPALQVLFWVCIVALYLLGALSLLVRSQFDLGGAGQSTPVAAVTSVATAIPTAVTPAATVPPASPAPATPTPHPTLTPRSTLYPTLTPRP